jgi:hypothetical protein
VEFQQYEDNDWCLTCYEDKMEALEEEALKLRGNIDNPKGERGAK